MFDEDFLRDNPEQIDDDMFAELAAEEEPDEIELAFNKIRASVDDGLADCDDKLDDIMKRLPADLPPLPPIAPVESNPKPNNNTPLNKGINHMAQTAAPMSDKARATLRAAGGSSWQLLLGFGISFAVRVGLLGVVLGSWLDKQFFGGTGVAAMGIIVLVIFYSFYMLYRDVTRQDKLQKELAEEMLTAEKQK